MKEYHRPWADQLAHAHAGQITADNVHGIVQQAVGQVFRRVLLDAGVFKRDDAGQAGFKQFVRALTQSAK
jgi:UDPglucose--hexose-1-phosphate uridylyltransferase